MKGPKYEEKIAIWLAREGNPQRGSLASSADVETSHSLRLLPTNYSPPFDRKTSLASPLQMLMDDSIAKIENATLQPFDKSIYY
jgi:hypothetical protein